MITCKDLNKRTTGLPIVRDVKQYLSEPTVDRNPTYKSLTSCQVFTAVQGTTLGCDAVQTGR
jgi:hypothetical protein